MNCKQEHLIREANELVSIFNAADMTAKKNRTEANPKITKSLNLKIRNKKCIYKNETEF
jgi:hypothetical protein